MVEATGASGTASAMGDLHLLLTVPTSYFHQRLNEATDAFTITVVLFVLFVLFSELFALFDQKKRLGLSNRTCMTATTLVAVLIMLMATLVLQSSAAGTQMGVLHAGEAEHNSDLMAARLRATTTQAIPALSRIAKLHQQSLGFVSYSNATRVNGDDAQNARTQAVKSECHVGGSGEPQGGACTSYMVADLQRLRKVGGALMTSLNAYPNRTYNLSVAASPAHGTMEGHSSLTGRYLSMVPSMAGNAIFWVEGVGYPEPRRKDFVQLQWDFERQRLDASQSFASTDVVWNGKTEFRDSFWTSFSAWRKTSGGAGKTDQALPTWLGAERTLRLWDGVAQMKGVEGDETMDTFLTTVEQRPVSKGASWHAYAPLGRSLWRVRGSATRAQEIVMSGMDAKGEWGSEEGLVGEEEEE